MGKTKNQKKGEICEKMVSKKLQKNCLILLPCDIGADFICINKNHEISFHEAKCNKSGLTSYQKRLKKLVEAFGLKYETHRCSCPI